ncbi:hypothetical protein EV421DRAFT_1805947 [Armillaria borealis]|uniref:Uncharacterized protein n=1 Tax=Armillaria borealis TaxID=47425 RepID=A0AA39JMT9_9AGAR|nr:hypothetical protein EV421DRAFT_1805947 [Armillaria borealis]
MGGRSVSIGTLVLMHRCVFEAHNHPASLFAVLTYCVIACADWIINVYLPNFALLPGHLPYFSSVTVAINTVLRLRGVTALQGMTFAINSDLAKYAVQKRHNDSDLMVLLRYI